MGIATILEARELLLLATDAQKADALAAAIDGPIGFDNPASALGLHPAVTILCDGEAAAKIKSKRAASGLN